MFNIIPSIDQFVLEVLQPKNKQINTKNKSVKKRNPHETKHQMDIHKSDKNNKSITFRYEK